MPPEVNEVTEGNAGRNQLRQQTKLPRKPQSLTSRSCSERFVNPTLALVNEAVSKFLRRMIKAKESASASETILSVVGNRANWVATLVASLIVICACAATLSLGLAHMSIYGSDIFTFLDGSWRVVQGKVPHVDFYSAFGPLFYLMQAAGLRISHYQVEGIVYGTVAAGVLLGSWSVAIIRIRLNTLLALMCTVFVTLFWLAPFPIGEPYYQPSYAMQYNRLGYVILFLIAVELFGASEEETDSSWTGFSSGAALAALLFLKANFFIAGLGLVLGTYILRIKRGRHAASLVAGFLIVFCVMSSYLRWHLEALWNDLRIAAAARQARFHPLKDGLRSPIRNATPVLTMIGLGVVACLRRKQRGADQGLALPFLQRPVATPALLVGADFVLSLSNQQRFGFPLTTLAILLVVDQLCRVQEKLPDRERLTLAMSLLLVSSASVLPFITETVNAWAIQVTMRQNPSIGTTARIDAAPVKNLVFGDHVDSVWGQGEMNGRAFTAQVNDGLAVLRENTGPDDRIACLCFANPFSYSLLRKPMEGGAAWFDYGTNFTEKHAPPATKILGDADVVIYPRSEDNGQTVKVLLEICGSLLRAHYKTVAESRYWILLKKVVPTS